MNNLNQTISDFADYILQTPEFVELQEATEQLNNNKEALSVLQDLQGKRQTVFTLQQTGLPVSEKTTAGTTRCLCQNACQCNLHAVSKSAKYCYSNSS